MPAMPLDEDKRRDSKRDDAHLGQPTSLPHMSCISTTQG